MASSTDDNICGTLVTIQQLQDILKSHSGSEKCTLQSWSAEIIAQGQGYVSNIIRVQLQWDSGDLPNSVILKVPTTKKVNTEFGKFTETEEDKAAIADVMDEMLPMIHKNECSAYRVFGNQPPLKAPVAYFVQEIDPQKQGLIVMEDKSAEGQVADVISGLNVRQVEAIARALADLHAFCIRNQGSWENQFMLFSKESVKEMFQSMENLMMGMLKATQATDPEFYTDDVIQRFAKIMDPDKMIEVMYGSHVELGMPPVLVHGDLWCNNILFNGDELVSIIDWQVSHPGNCAEDLARLMLSSCSGEMRRVEEQKILRVYYDELCEKLEGKAPYSFDSVQAAYKKIFPNAVANAFGVAAFIGNMPAVQEAPDKEQKIAGLMQRSRFMIEDYFAALK